MPLGDVGAFQLTGCDSRALRDDRSFGQSGTLSVAWAVQVQYCVQYRPLGRRLPEWKFARVLTTTKKRLLACRLGVRQCHCADGSLERSANAHVPQHRHDARRVWARHRRLNGRLRRMTVGAGV